MCAVATPTRESRRRHGIAGTKNGCEQGLAECSAVRSCAAASERRGPGTQGRQAFEALEYNKVQAGVDAASSKPRVRIATDKFAWDVFRFGAYSTLTPWPDERFPMNTVGVGPGSTLTFYKQVIPDMSQTLGVFGPE